MTFQTVSQPTTGRAGVDFEDLHFGGRHLGAGGAAAALPESGDEGRPRRPFYGQACPAALRLQGACGGGSDALDDPPGESDGGPRA